MGRYDRRYDRQNKTGWFLLLVIVGFALYLGIDSGWLNTDTIKSLLPNSPSKQMVLCEQNGYTPPCITAEGVEVVPNEQSIPQQPSPVPTPIVDAVPQEGRILTFVDAGANPIVGMPVKLWRNGEQIQTQTDPNGQVVVYTEGFDPNIESSYIVYGDRSGIINGRKVIVVQ